MVLFTVANGSVSVVAMVAVALEPSRRVLAAGVLVTAVLAGGALVVLDAREIVQPDVSVQALALVRSGRVDAHRVGAAPVVLRSAAGGALVHVCNPIHSQ